MEQMSVSNDFVDFSIRKFKSLLCQRRKHYCEVKGLKEQPECSLYDQAKQHETKTRNLKKALSFYVKAALNGQKINSCIKDFASVLHQSGYTDKAISFLEEMRPAYKGQKQKYDRLIKNLQHQLKPTGKHDYTKILIDLIDIRLQNPQTQIASMFTNSSRIKTIQCFDDLGFNSKNKNGRYVLLRFDSFSAAKKTIQTFKKEQWFGIDRFWLNSNFYIVAEAFNGKTDFELGVIFNKGQIQETYGQKISQCSTFSRIQATKFKSLEKLNEEIIYIIHNCANGMKSSQTQINC